MAAIPPQLIGESSEFHALLDWVSDIASLNVPVLVLGEAGSGKEMIASRIHFLSQRWEQGYYRVNCAAYDADQLDGIIYGDDVQGGVLAQAESGTLFFDNIESLKDRQLERLVHLAEYSSYEQGGEDHSVDIRLVFSANPLKIIQSDRRERLGDYMDRLGGDVVHIPPLRERRSDIASLMIHFGRKAASRLGAGQFPGVTSEALEALMAHDWPDNVRGLKNVVERTTARAFLVDEMLSQPIADIHFNPFGRAFRSPAPQPQPLEMEAVPPVRGQSVEQMPKALETEMIQPTDFSGRIMTFERGLIDEAMQVSDHHQGKAADYLGLTYHQFRGLLRKHGLKK